MCRSPQRIKQDLDTELGFTFSVGLAPNKVVAKIASKWQKPSGLTAIPGRELHRFLAQLPVENVWGIGHRPRPCCINTACGPPCNSPSSPRPGSRQYVSKPFYQIWQEFNGTSVLELETQ